VVVSQHRATTHVSSMTATTAKVPLKYQYAPRITTANSLLQIQLAIMILVALAIWAAKSAVLALYIRVFGSVAWLRRTAYTWIAIMDLVYNINIIVGVVYRVPRQGEVWGSRRSFRRCSSTRWPFILVGVFSCLADLLIFLLPFPIILNLQVNL
jgi:hypothetical protein